MQFDDKLDDGTEIIVNADGYEYSPDINVIGHTEICANDLDGNTVDL